MWTTFACTHVVHTHIHTHHYTHRHMHIQTPGTHCNAGSHTLMHVCISWAQYLCVHTHLAVTALAIEQALVVSSKSRVKEHEINVPPDEIIVPITVQIVVSQMLSLSQGNMTWTICLRGQSYGAGCMYKVPILWYTEVVYSLLDVPIYAVLSRGRAWNGMHYWEHI